MEDFQERWESDQGSAEASMISQSLEEDTKAIYMSSKDTECDSRCVHRKEVLEKEKGRL